MRVCVLTEPQQGASFADQLSIARHAEDLGFEGFFRSDHFLAMGPAQGMPPAAEHSCGPTDSWLTLAGIAMRTSRIRLGTLVSSATFRLPGPLAIAVAQLDDMSGGRAELGLGAGWFEAEHAACGIPFPAAGERFDRLEEQLAIISGLWATPPGGSFTFRGRHYELAGSPALPRPAQAPRPPIIVGGLGRRRTPALAARYADEFNVPFGSVRDTAEAFARVRTACQEAGREPPVLSAAQVVACGATVAQARDRCAAAGGEPFLSGTPGRVAERIGQFRQAGASRVYLEMLDLADLGHLDLIAGAVLPALS